MIDIDLPYARLLGVRLIAADECDEGTPMAAMEPCEIAVGRPGFLHGGAIEHRCRADRSTEPNEQRVSA